MKTEIDRKGKLTITIGTSRVDGESECIVTLDLFRAFEAMDDESKMKVAEALTWGNVLKEAIRRLTGNADSWAGDDNELSAEVLREMHEHAVGAPVWFWSIEKKLQEYARDLEHGEALYWRLREDRSPVIRAFPGGQPLETMGDLFRLWADRNGVSSNYTDRNERFESFKKEVFDLIHSVSSERAEAK